MNFIKTQPSKDCFYPQNKKKYVGQYPIRIMSQWERKFCEWCDNNSNVLSWSSEPLSIPYQHPLEQRGARYYPDFLIQCKTKKGNIKNYLIEVKPNKEVKQPTKSKNKSKKTELYEQKNWEINKAKWKAAQRYCKLKEWTFKLITEKELFRKGKWD